MSEQESADLASQLQAVIDTVVDGIITADSTGAIRSFNPAAERLFGYRAAEVLGRNIRVLMPEPYRSRHEDAFARYLAEGTHRIVGLSIGLEAEGLRKDGSRIPVELTVSETPVRGERWFTGIARDITERKRVEAELLALNTNLDALVYERTRQLQASERRFESLVEFAPDALVMTNQQGAIILVNRQAEAMFGWSRTELVGQLVEVLMPGASRPNHPRLRESYLKGAVPRAMGGARSNLRGKRKDGTEFPVDISLSPIASADGPLVAAAVRDMTEHRQLEAQLQQGRRMESVGRLAGGIAHDFNNLLTVIIGMVDLALMGLREQDPLHADLERVRKAGERAAGLTRQLLAFSRKQVLQPKDLSLDRVVEQMLGMLERVLGEHIKIVLLPAKTPGIVKADPGQIEQVIMNLAVNARDAMPEGGTLTIETRDVVLDEEYAAEHPSVRPGPHVMLAFSDTGVGMDEATRRQIFEPFFTTKAPGNGTGLGLSTVHGIVNQSGGSVSVYSEVGRGSTFRVYLPLAEGTMSVDDRHAGAAVVARGGEKVLVVEDDDAVRHLAVRFLESAGYAVRAAPNGEEALRLLERDGPVDVVVTDVIMPGLNGRNLSHRVLALHPQTAIVFTSGYTDDAIAHHGVLDEGTHFLTKPYTASELTRKVRTAMPEL